MNENAYNTVGNHHISTNINETPSRDGCQATSASYIYVYHNTNTCIYLHLDRPPITEGRRSTVDVANEHSIFS